MTTCGANAALEHGSATADYNVHVYMRQDGLAGTVTADLEYPPRVAFVLLTQVRACNSEPSVLTPRCRKRSP